MQFWTLEMTNVIMFKQLVKLELTSSGHYCVNLRNESTPDGSDIQNEDDILIATESMTKQEKLKILLKLYKQFGHASVDRLKKTTDLIR